MADIRKHYYEDEVLRSSFNRLAQETFGIDFEDWYQNGYWKEKYIPYSVVQNGEVVANVSVNLMDMREKGTVRHLIQLGTVMTKKEYRKQGFIRMLMREIEADYDGKVDGMYLFANGSVLDFYPKFGYRRAAEYQYVKPIIKAGTADGETAQQKSGEAAIKQMPMRNKSEWDVLERAIKKSRYRGRFDMVGNTELIMFYVTKYMQDNVFYDERQDAWAIAETEDDELLLHGVFSEREVKLDELIDSFGRELKKAALGFTPADTAGYDCRRFQLEDTFLFVKGDAFADFEEKRFMFPLLSHA